MLVVGIGNVDRCDDGVGLYIAQEIAKAKPSGVTVVESTGEITELLELWSNFKRVIIVDALCSGAQAGSVVCFDVHKEALPAELFHTSTHGWGLAEAVALARTLQQLPKQLLVLGVEGKEFGMGRGLSLEVEKVVDRVVEQVLAVCKCEGKGGKEDVSR